MANNKGGFFLNLLTLDKSLVAKTKPYTLFSHANSPTADRLAQKYSRFHQDSYTTVVGQPVILSFFQLARPKLVEENFFRG